jgi:hypothetical protein
MPSTAQQDTTNTPRRSSTPPNDDGFPRSELPSELWYPGLAPVLHSATTEYLSKLHRGSIEPERSRFELIDIAFRLLENRDFDPDRLNEDEQVIAAEIILQQARSFEDLNHPIDALASLKLAVQVGLPNPETLDPFPCLTNEPKLMLELAHRIEQDQARRRERRIEQAFQRESMVPLSATLRDGIQAISLAQLLGPRNLIVTWVQWSPACRQTLENLAGLRDRLDETKIRPVLVSVPHSQRARLSPPTLEENELAYLHSLRTQAKSVVIPWETTTVLYGIMGYPGVACVDQDGQVRGVCRGYVDRATLEGILDCYLAKSEGKSGGDTSKNEPTR